MESGLRRGARGEITLPLRFLFRGQLSGRLGSGLFLHDRIHVRFSGWRRRFLVGRDSVSNHLTVDELVAVNMSPDAARVGPTGSKRRSRLNFRGGV